MNNGWTDKRNSMHASTVMGLMVSKMNYQRNYKQFFDKIKTNTKFLKKVHSSDRYQTKK